MQPGAILAIDGLSNFRDVGGYPAGARTVRAGLVYRSDSPHQASEEGRAAMTALGIVSVLDLRTPAEYTSSPGPFTSDHHPIQEDLERDGIDPRSVAGRDGGEQLLADLYVLLLERSAERFGGVLTQLADADRLPAVVHCAAGKDRTGLAVALLLSVLGVDRDLVLDDYAIVRAGPAFESRLHDVRARFLAEGIEPGAADGMLGTPRWAMAHALSHLDERHGSVDAYVAGPGGVPPPTIDRLRAVLLQD